MTAQSIRPIRLSPRGVIVIEPENMGTVRVMWPDGLVTEVRRPPKDPDTLRLRVHNGEWQWDDVPLAVGLTIREHYGRGADNYIVGFRIEREGQHPSDD